MTIKQGCFAIDLLSPNNPINIGEHFSAFGQNHLNTCLLFCLVAIFTASVIRRASLDPRVVICLSILLSRLDFYSNFRHLYYILSFSSLLGMYSFMLSQPSCGCLTAGWLCCCYSEPHWTSEPGNAFTQHCLPGSEPLALTPLPHPETLVSASANQMWASYQCNQNLLPQILCCVNILRYIHF